jgi:hypothetical protein
MKAKEVKPKKGRVYLPEEQIIVEGFEDNSKVSKPNKEIIIEDAKPEKKSRLVAKVVETREAGEKNNWVNKLLRNKKGNEKSKGREM